MRWAFSNLKASIPSTYVLAKRKKLFMKARCIIAYAGFWAAKFQRAMGKVISDLQHLIIEHDHFDCPSLDELMRKVQLFTESLSDTWEKNASNYSTFSLQILADDLEGFFPSPPHELMLASGAWLVERICDVKGRAPHEICISVSSRNKCSSFFGRRTTEEKHQAFPLDLLLPLMQLTLDVALCNVLGTVKRQIRGAPIGCPCSPQWMLLVVCRREYLWLQGIQHRILRHHSWQVVRYVDNRLAFYLEINNEKQMPVELFDEKFYGETIVLKPEPKDAIIGAQLFVKNQKGTPALHRAPQIECRFVVLGFPPTYSWGQKLAVEELWRYRTWECAASKRNLLSAFVARLHLACRASFPTFRACEAICRVVLVYIMLGYPPQELCKSLRKFCRGKTSHVIPKSFQLRVNDILYRRDYATLHALGGC